MGEPEVTDSAEVSSEENSEFAAESREKESFAESGEVQKKGNTVESKSDGKNETATGAGETEKADTSGHDEFEKTTITESEDAVSEDNTVSTAPKSLVIELDPGHGGKDGGAADPSDTISESAVNLKIAKYLKEELETYDGVTVYLTREDNSAVDLEYRVQKALKDGADILISLHNNATGPMAPYDNGCTVLVQRGVYHGESAKVTQEIGCYILKSLSQLGLENRGLLFRVCQNQKTYPNGELTDYYSIVRNSALYDIPGIIIEHAFIDKKEEFDQYLENDEKIKMLAHADAIGIASYYHLQGDEEQRKEFFNLKNHTETIMLVTTDDSEDNEYLKRKYFQSAE